MARIPPWYVNVPSGLIYGPDRLPAELHLSYEIILGLAWRTNYERTPPVTVRELAELRGVDERTMARHIARLKDEKYLKAGEGREGQPQIYYPQKVYQGQGTAVAQGRPRLRFGETIEQRRSNLPPLNPPLSGGEEGTPDTGVRGRDADVRGGSISVVVDDAASYEISLEDLDEQQQQQYWALLALSCQPDKAVELAARYDPELIEGWIDYATEAKGIRNKVGLVISSVERGLKPPSGDDGRRYLGGKYADYIDH